MIRRGTYKDLYQLVQMSIDSMEENKVAELGCPVDIGVLTRLIESRIKQELVLVSEIENSTELSGCLIASRSTPLYSNRVCIGTDIFFIKEKYRSLKLVCNFMSIYKECAILNRWPIVFDLFAQKDVQRKKNLMKYLGFKDFGSSLVFVVEE